ncbi:MAG: DegT/DnrJ/EryC1/StrS family aminotransferase [Proteobacteria bacterium]|nr:DegT/DnrJ/EryC1/StrS family aminotransferase [Pseudomonadota bacterium]MBU1640700.1 DegT/DnrJ/EryC1/StrS family aminotransferase [Pseudomonadota bacterium]
MTFFALPPAEARLPFRALASSFFPGVGDFENDLRRYVNAEVCVLASSARGLLALLFEALAQKRTVSSCEILVPGYTCYSLAAAVVKAGCKVAVYDMDPHTFQPDLADVKRKINSRTLAVVGQHLLGVQSDINSLARIAHESGIVCVEDSAQYLTEANAASQQGRAADFTVFSFGRGKPLPLGGGGALIASKAPELVRLDHDFDVLTAKSPHCLLPFVVQIFSRPYFYWILEKLPLGLGRTVYDPAFSVSAMPLLYQRIGSASLSALARLNRHRSAIGHIYHILFAKEGGGGDLAGMPPLIRYPLLVSNQQDAQSLAMLGIRQFYPHALCDLPALSTSLAGDGRPTPGAREIANRLVTLPTHLAVNEKIARNIAKRVCACLDGLETIEFGRISVAEGCGTCGE